MNAGLKEGSRRSLVLELWWLKARRATSGQNNAAVRAAKIDRRLTVANIFLPITVLAFAATQSIAHYVDAHLWINFTDLMALGSGGVAALSVFQLAGDYKVSAILHRQASCEFEGIAQQIEGIEFYTGNDELFEEISNRFERAERSSRHVSDEDWEPARKKFDSDIVQVRNFLRSHEQSVAQATK